MKCVRKTSLLVPCEGNTRRVQLLGFFAWPMRGVALHSRAGGNPGAFSRPLATCNSLRNSSARYLALLLLALSSLGSGCASTRGSARIVTPPSSNLASAQLADLVVEIEGRSEVPLKDVDRERILNLIINSIKTESPNRFRAINQPNPGSDTLRATVIVKRYEAGNAFARAMLIGLGQIHIDADVALSNWETKESIAQYEVNKTFAWGGLYGGFTDIRDVEDGFAKAVASSILGKRE